MATFYVETVRAPFGGVNGAQKLDVVVHNGGKDGTNFSRDQLSPSMTAVFEVEHVKTKTDALACVIEHAAGLGTSARLRFGGKTKPRETPMKPRGSMPTECSTMDDEQAFRVWGNCPVYDSTASHGGIFLPPEYLHNITPEGRADAMRWSGSEQWYEEDCCWAHVAVGMTDLFKPEVVKVACDILKSRGFAVPQFAQDIADKVREPEPVTEAPAGWTSI